MRGLVTFLVFAGLLGGAGYGIFRYADKLREDARPTVRTAEVTPRDLQQMVRASGEVRPVLEAIVKSEISGRIDKIFVEEGDAVERGQTLLQLDTVSLQTRLRETQRNLEGENLRYTQAKRNFDRIKELFDRQFVGEREYLDAETSYNLAALAIEISQTRLEDAREDLGKATIVAPQDGVITQLNVTEGQVITGASSVTNGTDLITMAELDRLFMEANINEIDVSRIRVNDVVQITFDAYPTLRAEGRINQIAPAARRDGNTRVFPIRIQFAVEDARIRPGISATVSITIESVDNVPSIPLPAVFADGQDRFVFVRDGNVFRRQNVEVGISNLRHIQIRDGLEPGMVVAMTRPPAEMMAD